jgi:hypothetical protein
VSRSGVSYMFKLFLPVFAALRERGRGVSQHAVVDTQEIYRNRVGLVDARNIEQEFKGTVQRK